jgi:hypothetical protein
MRTSPHGTISAVILGTPIDAREPRTSRKTARAVFVAPPTAAGAPRPVACNVLGDPSSRNYEPARGDPTAIADVGGLLSPTPLNPFPCRDVLMHIRCSASTAKPCWTLLQEQARQRAVNSAAVAQVGV